MASAYAQNEKTKGSSSVRVSLNAQTLLVLYVNLQFHSYTMPMEQTDLCQSSVHRTAQQIAFVSLCDSTHTIEISNSHRYDYIQWWNGSNTHVISIEFLFIPPWRQPHKWPNRVGGYYANSSIHSFSTLTTSPTLLPKRFLHIVRSRASSFKSSSRFLRLLPRLLVTSISPLIFPSITRFRRQFRRKIWPVQLAFRFLISCRIFLCSLTLSNTSFLTYFANKLHQNITVYLLLLILYSRDGISLLCVRYESWFEWSKTIEAFAHLINLNSKMRNTESFLHLRSSELKRECGHNSATNYILFCEKCGSCFCMLSRSTTR
jgi:hypothetical protein